MLECRPHRPTCPPPALALSSNRHSLPHESDLDLVSVQLTETGGRGGLGRRDRRAPTSQGQAGSFALHRPLTPTPLSRSLATQSWSGAGERGVHVPPLGTRVARRNNSRPGPSRCCLRLEETVGSGGTPVPQKEARGRGLLFWRRWYLQTGAAPAFCCLSRESSERKKEASKFLNGETAATSSAELPPPPAGGWEPAERQPAAAAAAARPHGSPVSGHLGESQPPRQLGWGGKTAPEISQGALSSLLCPWTNGGCTTISGRKGCWEV